MRRGLVLLIWLLAVPPLVSCVGSLTHTRFDPLEPTRLGWLTDLAATLAAQAIVPGALCVALAIVMRRLVAGLLALVSLLVLVVAILDIERAPSVSEPEGPIVSVLAINAWSASAQGAAQFETMLAADADVIMLNEVSIDLLAVIRTDPRVREAYPYFRLPDRAGPGFRFVLSRHPIARGGDAFGFVWPEIETALGYHGQRVLRVELPQGPFVFAGVQFRSPRSPYRWALGNEQAADTALGLSIIAERTLLPIIVVGDLNASPVGVRSRQLAASTGLVRIKPALRVGGTYPATLPALAQVPIDGGLVSRGVRVASYQTLAVPGSDHRAVLMVFELPGQKSGQQSGQQFGQDTRSAESP